jgi:hypothetical protein
MTSRCEQVRRLREFLPTPVEQGEDAIHPECNGTLEHMSRLADIVVLHPAHVVVHPVNHDIVGRPFRRVDILGRDVGHAFDPADVAAFMRRAGLDTSSVYDPDTVEWEGDGSDVWQ